MNGSNQHGTAFTLPKKLGPGTAAAVAASVAGRRPAAIAWAAKSCLVAALEGQGRH